MHPRHRYVTARSILLGTSDYDCQSWDGRGATPHGDDVGEQKDACAISIIDHKGKRSNRRIPCPMFVPIGPTRSGTQDTTTLAG